MKETLPGHVRALTLHMHRDCADCDPGLESSNDFQRDRKLLRDLPYDRLLVELPRIGKALDSCLAKGVTPNLREWNDVSLPERFMRYWLTNSDHDLSLGQVRAARQFALLFSKLDTGNRSNDLDAQAIQDFVERNSEVGRQGPWYDDDLARYGKIAMYHALSGLDLLNIKPGHGQGAVATGEQMWEKMRFRRIYEDMDKFYPVDSFFFLDVHHLSAALPLDSWEVLPCSRAKLAVVPKDFRGPRIISMEPLEKMWIQQGQARAMMRHLESHPITRGHVNFTSQDVNRQLALRGSVKNDFVTIDLKDASDRVSVQLVQTLMPHEFFELLCATRSATTRLPDGSEVALNMFAPMGSACCFPVESIVFWAICVAAIAHEESSAPTRRSIWRAARAVFVYGDDIIVPTEYYVLVRDALSHFGLVVNELKCCEGPHFRESCGWDCYDGGLVTPIRIKQLPDVRSPSSLTASIKYINALYRCGYSRTASYLRDLTTAEFGEIPMSSNPDLDGVAILTPFRSEALEWNFCHFKSRSNPRLQRTEFLIPSVGVRRLARRYTCWSELFRSLVTEAPEGGLLDYTIPHRVRRQQRWCAL